MKYYTTLTNALISNGAFGSSVLATISEEFSFGCILHEPTRIGVPDNVLMLFADRSNRVTNLEDTTLHSKHKSNYMRYGPRYHYIKANDRTNS